MCGIVGCHPAKKIGPMLQAIKHRGPDGCGVHDGECFLLGAHSLKITDRLGLTQPLYNENGKICIVLNGEIFNYKELRKSLSQHRFQTETDTEVIIHAYEEYGIQCVRQFNGCFAFALLDGDTLYLVRDRLGQKPLYYAFQSGHLIFGSEIKSVISQLERIEPHLSASFFAFETTFGNETLFEGVCAVPPASILKCENGILSFQKYWSLEEGALSLPYSKRVALFQSLLEDSIRLRMCGDREKGLFLSGGLDSALIAYLGKPEYMFSSILPDSRFDERAYIERIVNDCKARHFFVEPSAKRFSEVMPKLIWHLDEPLATASPFAAYLLAEEASKHVSIILTGEGADELFGGYIRYLFMLYGCEVLLQGAYLLYAPMAEMYERVQSLPDFVERYSRFIQRGNIDYEAFRSFFHGCTENFQSDLNKMLAIDLRVSLPPLLTMIDRVTGAFGMENRSPYLDYRIIEFAFSLPDQDKIKGMRTKAIMRDAARGIVPDVIIDRHDKMGLITPVTNWLSSSLKLWKEPLIKRCEERMISFPQALYNRGEFDRSEYMKLCTELWYQIFIDQ